MQRKFFSALGLVFALNLLIKPLWIFAIDRPVQNIVGTETYGSYFAIFNLCVVFNFLLDLGITTYLNQQKSKDAEKSLFIQGLLLKTWLGILYAVLLIIIAWVAGIKEKNWLVLAGLQQLLYSFFLYLRGYITALQLFKADAFLSILDKLLVIICCGALIYFPMAFGHISIDYFLWIQILSLATALLIALIILISHKGMRLLNKKISITPSDLLWKALPYGLLVLLMSMHNRLDAFLLERLHVHGNHEAGIYAQAYRLLDAANMLGYLMASFLLPFAAKHLQQIKIIQPLVRKLTIAIICISAPLIVSCFVFAVPIQSLLYHSKDLSTAQLIPLCMTAITGYWLVQVYGTLLTAAGAIKLFMAITIPFMLLNIVLNIIFIPTHGAYAAAIIAIITESCYGITVWIVANRKIKEIAMAQNLLKLDT